MFDNETLVNVYSAGDKFKFNVDAVSGTLHKSTRKSKLCVKDKKEGYEEFEYDRRWMSENLTKAIVQSVCKYLEDKHIATFDFR